MDAQNIPLHELVWFDPSCTDDSMPQLQSSHCRPQKIFTISQPPNHHLNQMSNYDVPAIRPFHLRQKRKKRTPWIPFWTLPIRPHPIRRPTTNFHCRQLSHPTIHWFVQTALRPYPLPHSVLPWRLEPPWPCFSKLWQIDSWGRRWLFSRIKGHLALDVGPFGFWSFGPSLVTHRTRLVAHLRLREISHCWNRTIY